MSFISQQRVRSGHCDPVGIAHYPRLIELIDVASEERKPCGTGVSRRTMHLDLAPGLPTVAIETKFEGPCQLEEMFDLAVDVAAVGTTSVSLKVTATCVGAPRYTATPTQVLIALGTGKPPRWQSAWHKPLSASTTGEGTA